MNSLEMIALNQLEKELEGIQSIVTNNSEQAIITSLSHIRQNVKKSQSILKAIYDNNPRI